jgi:hypothetical protein
MNSFNCDDKQTLIAYLYDEVDPATRHRVDAHLASCARCAAEVRALGDVRLELSQWAPPDAELGFAIVRKSEQPTGTVLRPARWWQTVPAWAQAAAAILVLAAGLSIANIQVRSGPDGFTVSTGWMPVPVPVAPALSEPFDGAAIERRVEGLEQQLRSEIRSSRAPEQARAAAAAPVDEATVRRVRQLLEASEQRQQRELAYRLTQFASEMDVLRRADAQRMTRGLVQFDEQMFRQQQLLNNIVRISGTPQQ